MPERPPKSLPEALPIGLPLSNLKTASKVVEHCSHHQAEDIPELPSSPVCAPVQTARPKPHFGSLRDSCQAPGRFATSPSRLGNQPPTEGAVHNVLLANWDWKTSRRFPRRLIRSFRQKLLAARQTVVTSAGSKKVFQDLLEPWPPNHLPCITRGIGSIFAGPDRLQRPAV